ncbi:MAG: ABC transporter permease subunit [Candidatus Poribacteria bacterium]|nr:ABC transporter permease subunit [Candidatus Poribacteria bacterium]
MIFHIVKRELYDHLSSLRFALTTLLILILMVVNAVGYLGEYKQQMNIYQNNVAATHNRLKRHSDTLYHLVLKGPGDLHKKPSPLAFCADGGKDLLFRHVRGGTASRTRRWEGENTSYRFTEIWRLVYPQASPDLIFISPPRSNTWSILPDFIKIDWAFVTATVLSFMGILFTFDAISGEQEHGTLRLMLANSVSRNAVICGKFLGAFFSIAIPFLIGAIVSLSIIYLSEAIQFKGSDWMRMGVVVCVALVYTSIFILLGLLVSTLTKQSSTSLVILLLIWTVWVVLTPNALGSLSSRLHARPSPKEFVTQYRNSRQDLQTRYFARIKEPPRREIPATIATALGAEYVNKDAELRDRLHADYLSTELRQIQTARYLTRISPAAVVQYAFEAFAGTGVPRHLDFISQTRQYAKQFRQFLIDTDRTDPESPHAIGIPEGTSQKPVNFDAIPKFEDRHRFSADFNAAIVDLLLLILFLLVLFISTFLSFLRKEIE